MRKQPSCPNKSNLHYFGYLHHLFKWMFHSFLLNGSRRNKTTLAIAQYDSASNSSDIRNPPLTCFLYSSLARWWFNSASVRWVISIENCSIQLWSSLGVKSSEGKMLWRSSFMTFIWLMWKERTKEHLLISVLIGFRLWIWLVSQPLLNLPTLIFQVLAWMTLFGYC